MPLDNIKELLGESIIPEFVPIILNFRRTNQSLQYFTSVKTEYLSIIHFMHSFFIRHMIPILKIGSIFSYYSVSEQQSRCLSFCRYPL